jgi:hypothetical protein
MKQELHDNRTQIIRMIMSFYDFAEAYRRENTALRSILHKQGLSDAVIQGRVRRLLKNSETDETAAQLLKRGCEEILAQLREIDLKRLLEETDIGGNPQ